MDIKFMGPVIFVRDIQSARRFYEGVLLRQVELDFGVNVGYVGGLALWQQEHAAAVIFPGAVEERQAHQNMAELCFETGEIEELYIRLQDAGVEFIHPLVEQPWGQRTVRFYDADGHILEVGERMEAVIARLLAQGASAEEAAQKTGMPLDTVLKTAQT
jgi:catechol 2,3-dioxygenase-like lactoylglutathione lyase family enzyme